MPSEAYTLPSAQAGAKNLKGLQKTSPLLCQLGSQEPLCTLSSQSAEIIFLHLDKSCVDAVHLYQPASFPPVTDRAPPWTRIGSRRLGDDLSI